MYAVFYLFTTYINSKSAYIRLTILYAKIDRKAGLDYVKNALSKAIKCDMIRHKQSEFLL